jgi:3-oxoacyl-(acyl-carrier-protein) synthase
MLLPSSDGKANIIVTGGAEAPINVASIGGFNAAKAISTNNDEFASASRLLTKHATALSWGKVPHTRF